MKNNKKFKYLSHGHHHYLQHEDINLMFDQAPIGIARLDLNGRYVDLNHQYELISGYSVTEIQSSIFYQFTHPADKILDKIYFNQILSGDIDSFFLEKRYIRKDKAMIWIHFTLSLIRNEENHLPQFIMVTVEDISERKRVEANLRNNEERYRLLVLTQKDFAIFMIDLQGNIMSWNLGAETLFDYKEDEILNVPFSQIYRPEDILQELPEEAIKITMKEGSYHEEGWRIRKDDSHFWAQQIITRINDSQGNIIGFSVFVKEIVKG